MFSHSGMKYTFYQLGRTLGPPAVKKKADKFLTCPVDYVRPPARPPTLLFLYNCIKFFLWVGVTPQMPNILCCGGGIVKELFKEVPGQSRRPFSDRRGVTHAAADNGDHNLSDVHNWALLGGGCCGGGGELL